MKATATTVAGYLKELPKEKSDVLAQMLKFLRKHVPKGYRESMGFGMIWYCIPLEEYPHTYNKQPLGYIALAAQKNYFVLYLMAAYTDSDQAKALAKGFKAAGKKLDMGKSCLRFRSIDDLELDVIAEVIASMPPDKYIEWYEKAKGRPAS